MVMDYNDNDEYDSFKKPGSVPFKWEVKPGVPIIHHHQNQRVQSEPPSPKLRPPPAGSYLFSPVQTCSRSFRSAPKVRSDRFRFDHPLFSRPESVSAGCFFSPFLRRLKSNKKTTANRCNNSDNEPDYELEEIETLSRWSLSSKKSISPFRASTTSSYSITSSPGPISDAEWAGFSLF
ncbi:hypothetical protein TanjilG_09192 [Lupinus angustifolius]|uniref:Uncharacterized protein n=1 Tax=Lupinus angustifolius TaxID=3871 RepID=A0A4P1QWX6_LUPAN|nr:PREDICTED: uncharacterized protein LOC109327889 [Lupinus angustifolius]OIV96650.1 hypothetical protein TanjilG_09192 [Lupinus angustifolius]